MTAVSHLISVGWDTGSTCFMTCDELVMWYDVKSVMKVQQPSLCMLWSGRVSFLHARLSGFNSRWNHMMISVPYSILMQGRCCMFTSLRFDGSHWSRKDLPLPVLLTSVHHSRRESKPSLVSIHDHTENQCQTPWTSWASVGVYGIVY